MELNDFLYQLATEPFSIKFEDTMDIIDSNYAFTPTAFSNGEIENEAGQNNGSCKIFAFGLMHQLSEAQTLACFGQFYREDVLDHPENDDHQNIRNFMNYGWEGIKFSGEALR